MAIIGSESRRLDLCQVAVLFGQLLSDGQSNDLHCRALGQREIANVATDEL